MKSQHKQEPTNINATLSYDSAPKILEEAPIEKRNKVIHLLSLLFFIVITLASVSFAYLAQKSM